MPEECLNHVNCVSIGEGEKVCEEIILNSDNPDNIKRIKGVGYRDESGNITINPPSYIENIDALPFPRYEFGGAYSMLDKKGLRKLSIEDYKLYSRHNGDGYAPITSRSCPNNCSYCINSFYNKLYKGQGRARFFRRRSVKSTIEEIKYVLNTIPTVRFINFLDDHFLMGDEWLTEFLEVYGREINLPFMIRATPDSVTEEKIAALRKIGLETIQMGIQSGCEKTHREIFHRRFIREEITKATNILHKFGVIGMYDFIIGNEFETFAEKRQTIELMLEIPKPYLPDIFHIIPFPKTDIIKWYEKNGIKPKLDPYKENYISFEGDFFCMLANVVPLVDRDWVLKILDEAEDENKFEAAKRKVWDKYREFGGVDKIRRGVASQEE